MNINKLLKQAQEMQNKVNEVQEKMGSMEVDGTSGGGMVKVVMTGRGEVKGVKLDKAAVDPDDIEMLEDLLVAAFNDAKSKMDDAVSDEMAKVTGSLGLPPGMKMPF